ncbi:MAG: hypothetical protein KDD53_03300, partial [Bdellovibrionales bacterium]|nr:hypothetical protein [Bdellovibrionales bacterium]
QVLENIIRFWTWAAGLSHEKHMSFGHMYKPVEFGYLTFFLSEATSLGLIGIFLGILFLIGKIRTFNLDKISVFVIFLLSSSAIWMAFLSVSSKQGWRYAIPVLPLLYVVAALGYLSLFNWLGTMLRLTQAQTKRLSSLLSGAIICTAMVVTLSWAPNYLVYFNRLSGGIAGAVARNQGFALVGQKRIVDFLLNHANNTDEPGAIYTTLFAGQKTLDETVQRFYPKSDKKKIAFGFFPKYVADYAVVFSSHQNMVPATGWNDVISQKSVFEYLIHDYPVVRIYKVPFEEFKEALTISISKSPRYTGHIEFEKGSSLKIAVARPGEDSPGHLTFNLGVRVQPGQYKLTIPLRLLSDKSHEAALASQPTVRLELSKECTREVFFRELSPDKFTDISVSCATKISGRLMPALFWYGSSGIAASDLQFVSEASDS